MSSDWQWGPEAKIEDAETEAALRNVIKDGKQRKRRRTAAMGSGLAIIVFGGFVGGMVLTSSDENKKEVVTVAEARSEAPVTSVPPSTQAPAPVSARPTQLVTSENDNAGNGKLLVRSSSDGKVIRTLESRSERIGRVALDNNGKTAYYEVFNQECDGPSLRSIPVSGGRSTEISVFGNSPAVSPDGSKLAYNASAGCDVGSGLVVKDLRTGAIASFASNDTEVTDRGVVTSLPGTVAWLDNATVVASVSTSPETAPNQLNGLYAYDISKNNAPYSSGRKLPTTVPAGTYYNSIARMQNGDFYAVQSCCDPGRDSASAVTSQARMVILDPKTGQVKRTVATGFPDRRYTNTQADKSGAYLLYLSNDDLRISNNGSNPEVFISGITSADWK